MARLGWNNPAAHVAAGHVAETTEQDPKGTRGKDAFARAGIHLIWVTSGCLSVLSRAAT